MPKKKWRNEGISLHWPSYSKLILQHISRQSFSLTLLGASRPAGIGRELYCFIFYMIT
jgi:hypothetical protein